MGRLCAGDGAVGQWVRRFPIFKGASVAGSLFGLSFATALFALATFKLLSFFVMPSLFFDLLFIGFPLGAMLGARRAGGGRTPFLASLWVLQGVMAGSVGAGLLAKRLDYLRAHLFDVELVWLVAQLLGFAALFLPFFVAYGLCEFLGYRMGRREFGGRMRGVYALALFGAAAAYVFLHMALPALGMARVLACAFAGVAGSTYVLAGGWARKLALAELAALGILMAAPGLEGGFLRLYKGRGMLSTQDYEANRGCKTVFQKWGRYSLTEILEDPQSGTYYGFYNDLFQWEYARKMGFTAPSLGAIPVLRTKAGERIAIVGSGGGRQVRLAERLGGRKVVAIELEPAVFEAVRGESYLLRGFGRVYEAEGVTPENTEARGYFERSTGLFDLIYLPSVGGYAQMMIEPGNMVRTFQAYRLMRDRLTERGVLAIWYPRGLDDRGVLTDQYVRTLRLLGFNTQAYTNGSEFLILGFRDPNAVVPEPDALRADLKIDGPGMEAFRPKRYDVADDPRFTPITDEKPFLAGNVRHILSIRQVWTLFGLGLGTLGLAAAVAWRVLRRRADPEVSGRSYGSVGVLALSQG